MSYKRAMLAMSLAAIMSVTAGAQDAPAGGPGAPGARPANVGRISGLVTRAGTAQPIPGASAAVRSATDSALVGGAFAGDDGVFRVDGLPAGRYLVRIRVMGFAPVDRNDVVVTAANSAVDLGTIALAPVATVLSDVTVTAAQTDVAISPDRTSYNVKDTPAATGGSAVDVLRTVPSVEVDGDNKVSLRGNENVVVQINGRLSPMRGEALGNFLAQLPSNLVSRIEVVSNPSAKNDPEGMAGILNIVLKKNTDLGTSGDLTVGGASTGQMNASGNLGYQRGALTLFANYGFMRESREITGFIDRAGLQSGLTPYLDADVAGKSKGFSNSLNASADYKLGAKDAFSSNLIVSDRNPTRTNDNFYRALDANLGLTSSYLRSKLMTGDELSIDLALGYKHTGAQPGDGLSTDFRVNRGQDTDHVLLTDQSLSTTSGSSVGLPALETNLTKERATQWTLQSDFTRTLGSTKLETGYKGTLRQIDNDFSAALSTDGGSSYAGDPTQSNSFLYDEQVHAAYGVLSRTLGIFDLQAGLRAEKVSTGFDLTKTNEHFDNGYTSLYPSAIAAYNVTPTSQLKLSYSKRVTRPDMRQLNPFGFREDALNRFAGNPALRPEYTNAYELGLQQAFSHGTLQVTPFARHTVNTIRFIRTINDAGAATTSFANVATSDQYGADVNSSLRFGPISGFGGFSAFQQVTDASKLTNDASRKSFGWTARANLNVKLSPTLDAQAFGMYRAPMDVKFGRMWSMSMVNLALRQKVMGDKASVTFRVQDPFNTMAFGMTTDDGRYYQTTQRRFGGRAAFLSFSWNFGQQPRISKPRIEDRDEGGSPEGAGGR